MFIRDFPDFAAGGVKVCGDAVLRYLWHGFTEIFILTSDILVLLLLNKIWVTVIGDREVSAVLLLFFCAKCFVLHSQGPLLH